MKTVRFALYVLMLSAFAACSNGGDDGSDPTPPQPDKSTVTFPTDTDTAPVVAQAGGTSTLNFTATQSWSASVKEASRALDWISVSPTSGAAGDVTLTITTQPNDTPDERNAAITIASGGQKKTVTVSQKQRDALTVTSNKVELKAEGGDFSIEAKANVSISYEIAEDAKAWLKPVSARGLTTTTFAFTADANDATEKREGSITIKGDGLQEVVSVYQEGSQPTLVLTKDNYVVGADGDVLTVELKSNVAYELVLPSVDWLSEASSRAASAYTHRFEVAKNEGYDSRSAQIIFREKGGELADTVTVEQVQRDAIVLAKNEYVVGSEASTLEFTASANVDYTVTTSADWLTEVAARGLTNRLLRFNIAENTDTLGREATITLKAENVTQEILVKQMAKQVGPAELVSVEYRRSWYWCEDEEHCDLPFHIHPEVYCDSIYSDGTVITGRAKCNGFLVSTKVESGETNDPDIIIKSSYGTEERIEFGICEKVINDSIRTATQTIVVPDLAKVSVSGEKDYGYDETGALAVPGDWSGYQFTFPYQYEQMGSVVASNRSSLLNRTVRNVISQEWESCSREPGWYSAGTWRTWEREIYYNNYTSIAPLRLIIRYPDFYLSVNGLRIDYQDYWPEHTYNLIQEDIPASDTYGPGKKITYECKTKFFGRNFYAAVTYYVYERKKTEDVAQFYYLGHEDNGLRANKNLMNSFIVYANEKPILEEGTDWVHIDNITQSDFAYEHNGAKIYKWEVAWYPEFNDTRKERYGDIIVKDNQGKELGTIKVSQSPGFNFISGDIVYTPDFKDCSWGYGGFSMPGLSGTLAIKLDLQGLPMEVSSNIPWATSAARNGDTYIIKMPYNTGTATRQGTLTFRYKEYVEEIVISQKTLTDSQLAALKNAGIL